jgi:manganese oxidase
MAIELGGQASTRAIGRRRLLGVAAGSVAFAALAASPGRTDGSATPEAAGRTREYFVAAEEIDWDYAPAGTNLISGERFGDAERVFTERGPDRIGSVYRKAVYRGYTDDTFATPLAADPAWEHLGLLGPVIRAEVGDRLLVHFLNRTSRPASIHAHGVLYDKGNEGAPYADGTSGDATLDDRVNPGERFTYIWEVPERSGPGPHDPSSVVWMYHAHVDEVADTYAGLAGPIIVTGRGAANANGSPADVDREFILLFQVFDENQSPYLADSIARFAVEPSRVEPDDEDFVESNLMHAVNGYLYGNLPGLTMRSGERVRWYVIGMGTEVDLHTPHWHGSTLLWMGMRTDMVELLPMSMKVLDMEPDAPGTWFLHCHVNDHLTAGMSALFTVE